MQYDISLSIENTCAEPTGRARSLIRILPASIPGQQRLIAGNIQIDPLPDYRSDRYDFFGNAVTEAAFRMPLLRMTVSLQARVERTAAVLALDLTPALDQLAGEIQTNRYLDASAPHHFAGPSLRIRPNAPMTGFARETLHPGISVLEAVRAIGLRLHSEMRFDAEATDVDTPAEEAFEHRHGVCQDFSHVMIACLRGIGIPAGYVSGFLRTVPPPGARRLEGADAMHAWVRAWCGHQTGWVEYDPTNDQLVGGDHIVVGYGRDYSDVAPVHGVLRSSGAQDSRHVVDVLPLD